MTKNKTIGNRIISVLSAWTLFFSMFNSMENLFVRAGETEPEEMITDFIPEIPETTEKPDLLEIPAIDDEDLVLPEENFSDEDELADNPSELKQVSVPRTSVKSMASGTKSYTVTSDANYSEHTPEYYYQQYALKGFLNKFTLQYLDNDDNYTYLKSYTIAEKNTTDAFDSLQEIGANRLIPYQDTARFNEHTQQTNYSAVYKETDYLSSQADFKINKNGLTTLYINEYVGLSDDELHITKKVPYWNELADPTDDSFAFQVFIGDTNISESEDYTYYITPQTGKTDAEAKEQAISTKNAEFVLKSDQMLHIIGLLNGQNVKVKELPVSGYGVVTNDKMLYTEEEGYYTEIEYNNASDYQRTFTNYPLALSLTKKITNPENNAEVIEKSVFTFQLCKQDNGEYSPLTEAEMKKMRGYLLTSSTATKFEELTFFWK